MIRATCYVFILFGLLAIVARAVTEERPFDDPNFSSDEGGRPPHSPGREFNPERFDQFRGRGRFGGPDGFRDRFGSGGRPGPGGEERKLVQTFDRNDDGWLNADERRQARADAGSTQRGGGPFGGRGSASREPAKPGKKLSPTDVEQYPEAGLYDLDVIRTVFLEFESQDWEAELEAFHNTDVEVPATMTVDGETYDQVGIHFRGMSSYGMVPTGYKRSLNVAVDFLHPEQRLYGYKTLNLLNCNNDPSFMKSILFSKIANEHMPAPKVNLVRVVINGESWGLYANAQQFNKEFIEEFYGSRKGERWKVPGRPNGDGGLAYIGEDVEEYRRRYEIKSGDDEQAWKDLIELCRTISETPLDDLEAALEPILDVEEVLWFLALDVALVNEDGYWTRASDYSLYQYEDGRFHVIPHDMNETFHSGRRPGGPGGPGGPPPGFGPPGFDRNGRPDHRDPNRAAPQPTPSPGEILALPVRERLRLTQEQQLELADLQSKVDREIGNILTEHQLEQFAFMKMMHLMGANESHDQMPPGPPSGGPPGEGRGARPHAGDPRLDPLVSIDDERKPLRSRLLAVPALRERYLDYVRQIAEQQIDWSNLGPTVAELRTLIERDVREDTRKLMSFEDFLTSTADDSTDEHSLKAFCEQRREYLLNATSESR